MNGIKKEQNVDFTLLDLKVITSSPVETAGQCYQQPRGESLVARAIGESDRCARGWKWGRGRQSACGRAALTRARPAPRERRRRARRLGKSGQKRTFSARPATSDVLERCRGVPCFAGQWFLTNRFMCPMRRLPAAWAAGQNRRFGPCRRRLV